MEKESWATFWVSWIVAAAIWALLLLSFSGCAANAQVYALPQVDGWLVGQVVAAGECSQGDKEYYCEIWQKDDAIYLVVRNTDGTLHEVRMKKNGEEIKILYKERELGA